jgi:hypothetical protein
MALVRLFFPDFQHTLLAVVLYIGPDLIVPLTSALAAIAGVLLMFWNRVTELVRRGWRAIFSRNTTPRD